MADISVAVRTRTIFKLQKLLQATVTVQFKLRQSLFFGFNLYAAFIKATDAAQVGIVSSCLSFIQAACSA
jgi:hypothetical protein